MLLQGRLTFATIHTCLIPCCLLITPNHIQITNTASLRVPIDMYTYILSNNLQVSVQPNGRPPYVELYQPSGRLSFCITDNWHCFYSTVSSPSMLRLSAQHLLIELSNVASKECIRVMSKHYGMFNRQLELDNIECLSADFGLE
jgi:hypothetical protein